ncbi:hypothetical protein IU11_15190 [Cellulosimicrobium sp. MM]|nr:hypothetical protein [Cellulosimicrobium sp. MM]KFD43030.1 hypothetical protein IU11_15190 [Cellulosimicrobium sp. MM]
MGYGPFEAGWKGFLERFRTYTGKDAAEVHVAVPAGAQVEVATVQGEALVAGAREGVRLATVSGAVMTSRTRGPLRVDTVSGEVAASEHDGPVRMESVSAAHRHGRAALAALDSVSGSVTVTRARPGEITVSAVSADVLVRLPDRTHGLRRALPQRRLVVDGEEQRGSARPSTGGAARRGRARPRLGRLGRRHGPAGDGRDVVRPGRAPGAGRGPDAPAWGSPGAPPGDRPTSGPVDR